MLSLKRKVHFGNMNKHEEWIREAIALATAARSKGNEPFGALLVQNGKVILRAENLVGTTGDPTAHAELTLIQKAWREIPSRTIQSSTLYSSTEPCPMCAGAILWSRIPCVVFSYPALEQALTSNNRFPSSCSELFRQSVPPTELIGPILPEEGRRVHEGFWQRDGN